MSRVQKLMFILGFAQLKVFRRWVGGTWYYCWVQPCASHMWIDRHENHFIEKLVRVEISAEAKAVE